MNRRFAVVKTRVVFWVALALASVQISAASAQALEAFSSEDFKLARPRITQPIDDAAAVGIPGSRPRVLDRALAHRNDEFPVGYSSAGCSPALPASASAADRHLASKRRSGTMQF